MEIVKIVSYKELNVCLETENYDYLNKVYKHFEFFVKNYQFMPTFQTGRWNGKKSMFKKSSRSLPYGLLADLIRFTKLNFKDEITLVLDDDVKKMYKGIENPKPEWDLLFKPHYYQEEVIITALKNSKGIFRMPTASGKSLSITYIIKELIKNNLTKSALVVVPTIGLVKQFKEDMIDYFIPKEFIGVVDKDHKEWDNKIVISTWQSLKNNDNELKRFDTIIIDEVHSVRGNILHNLLKKSYAKWRFGFTGTMPDDQLDNLQVRSYLGPVFKSYKSSKLAKEGYIATCNINIIEINHKTKYTGTFSDVKNDLFASPFRLNIIKSLVKRVDGSILLLVDKVEKEGKLLEEFLKDQKELSNRKIMFLYGNINANDRAFWQKRAHKEKNIVLIATYGVFQMGINIKSLKYAVLCSSFKSSIRILQSIGRALRKHETKNEKGAFIFDMNDQVKYVKKHGDERRKFYEREEFNIVDSIINEGEPYLIELN